MLRFRAVMGRRTHLLVGLAVVCASVFFAAGSAMADEWFPHPANATWTYNWADTEYNPSGTTENVAVASQNAANGCGWNLAWTGTTEVPLGGTGGPVISQPDTGTMCFRDQDYGLENPDWSASAPPLDEPSLCPDPSSCSDSLGSTLFDVIWGSRNPVISEPLLQGTSWTATGGGSGNVTSAGPGSARRGSCGIASGVWVRSSVRSPNFVAGRKSSGAFHDSMNAGPQAGNFCVMSVLIRSIS